MTQGQPLGPRLVSQDQRTNGFTQGHQVGSAKAEPRIASHLSGPIV